MPPSAGGTRRRLLDLLPPSEAPPRIFDAAPPTPNPSPVPAPPGAVPLPPALTPPPPIRPRSAGPPSALPSPVSAHGLDERPLNPATDAKFLYESEAYGRAAQQILGAIWRHERVVVLSGATGMGKTLLCRSVIEQLDRRTLVSMVADRFVSIDGLLRTVLLDLGVISASEVAAGRLAQATRADLLGALRNFVVSIAPLQAFAVVIVDSADELPLDVLQELAGLTEVTGDAQLLQVLLVGRPRLLTMLARKELRPLADRVALRCRLGPLTSDDIPGYLAQRLAIAGGGPRAEFDDGALARVHELSQGVPGVVNVLCDRALGTDVGPAGVIDAAAIDEAAGDLGLERPLSAVMALARRAALAVVLSLLVAAGAAAAALLFRAEVAEFLSGWQNTPPAPSAPAPAIPPPIAPVRASPASDSGR